MQLNIFKTLWGHVGDFELACQQAVAAGFDGIEGPVPEDRAGIERAQSLLEQYQLQYIAEICTAGSYVPDRGASLQQHLDSLRQQLQRGVQLSPQFVTCLGGCDAWEEDVSLAFFSEAQALAEGSGQLISFETHRGRSMFNPWVTQRICSQLPDIRLTCDFSHWCVVCERLLEGEEAVLADILPHAFHIHARIGYDQGPQVPDPSAPRYAQAVERHWQWWKDIWRQHRDKGREVTTMTPEFGPDGYQAIDTASDQAVGDLWAMNQGMAREARVRFAQFNRYSQEAG